MIGSAELMSRVSRGILLAITFVWASTACAAQPTVYSFGVVPQQSASKLARIWGPMLAYVGHEAGIKLRFETAPDIPTFERRLAEGKYDFAYMNPYHYVVFSQKPGYRAIAHAKDRLIRGIVVIRKDAPYHQIRDLSGTTMAFPSPAAFAASILVRGAFARRHIPIKPKYVGSHDSVYLGVAKGLFPAGGGVLRTFMAMDPSVRDQLRILWETAGYTPHAIAAHPRVPPAVVAKVRNALVALDRSEQGRELLSALAIKGWQSAKDADWDDVRALHLDLLDQYLGP